MVPDNDNDVFVVVMDSYSDNNASVQRILHTHTNML